MSLHFGKKTQFSIPDRWDNVEETKFVGSPGDFLLVIIENLYTSSVSLQARARTRTCDSDVGSLS